MNELLSGADTPAAFSAHAVAEAQKQGLDVSVQEATVWINSQVTATLDVELSDFQLEAVAGGKKRMSFPEFARRFTGG